MGMGMERGRTAWAWIYNRPDFTGAVGSGTNWTDVSAGNEYTLAVQSDGTLWAWGWNGDGQLGLGDNIDRNSSVQVGSGTNVNISGFTVTGSAGSGKAGIHLGSRVSHCNISENAASGNYAGIYLNDADDNNVSCNWVQDNTDAGIYLIGGSTGNTIAKNNIIANGVLQAGGSYQWNFCNNQSDDVSTAGNWWGTDNTTRIDASICDWTYDTNWGNVTTSPGLTGPSPCAPVPELPTILLFAVGLLMLVGYVRIERRKM